MSGICRALGVSDKLDATRRSALLEAIVAFRIDIDSVEAKAKLGQNRTPAEVRAAAGELIRRDSGSTERQLALLMLEQVIEPRGVSLLDTQHHIEWGLSIGTVDRYHS
jgi:hypothetical protein